MPHSPTLHAHTEGTVLSLYAQLFAEACRHAGLCEREVLAQAGLAPLEPRTQSGRLPAWQVARAFAALDRHTHRPTLGLELARDLAPGSLDLVDYLMQHAATLRDALAQAARYFPLVAQLGRMELVESHGEAWLCHHPHPDVAALSQLALGMMVQRACAVSGARASSMEVGFRQGAHERRAEYAALLGGATVRFDQPCDHIKLPRAALDLPLQARDARLFAILERQADAHLAQLPRAAESEDELVLRVARELVLSGHASLERLAERLGTTSRTLQRRLAASGLSHRRLLARVRADVVERAMACGEADMRSLAQKLGYATPSSLRRARERWRDATP